MQSTMSVIINMNDSKLKHIGSPKLLSDLEQKKSRSGSQGKVADKEISSRSSITMQGIESVLVNVTDNKLIRKG